MSIKRMSTVWEKSGASGSALLLLLAIADYSDECGVSWPGEETLAHKIRMTSRSVRNLTDGLIELGELAKIGRMKRGGSNIYVILLDSTPEQLGVAADRVRHLGGEVNFSTPQVTGFPGGVEIASSGGVEIASSGGVEIASSGGVEIASSYDPSSSVIEPSLHDDDVQKQEKVVEALEERGWNAGPSGAIELVQRFGSDYMLALCFHAEKHKLGGGWIRKNAGTWKPPKNGNGSGNGGDHERRARHRFIEGEYADIIEH